eukprot:COSAG04_NODE_32827_length_194_cov_81.810526_1_plen_53_part_10
MTEADCTACVAGKYVEVTGSDADPLPTTTEYVPAAQSMQSVESPLPVTSMYLP